MWKDQFLKQRRRWLSYAIADFTVQVTARLRIIAAIAEAEKVTPRPSVKEWKLQQQVNIAVRNTGDETMQAVKASLIGLDGIKVTGAEQDYGILRIGAQITRDFGIEVPSKFKLLHCKLTLNLNFTTPTGKKKTCSYKLTRLQGPQGDRHGLDNYCDRLTFKTVATRSCDR